jgi:hypothetical protein
MIKSKKWYESQIMALKNAANKLQISGERMAEIYLNDIANLFKDREPLIKQLNEINNKLREIEAEYWLYYK